MSLFFNSANVSAAVSGLLYFLTIFISIVVWLRQGLSSAVVLVLPVGCRHTGGCGGPEGVVGLGQGMGVG